MSDVVFEWWLCSECLALAPSPEWGGTDSTAVCPSCGFEHRDNEASAVYAGSEMEMQRKRRELKDETPDQFEGNVGANIAGGRLRQEDDPRG